MKMIDVIDLVNNKGALYKFSRFGSSFCGLNEFSFTPKELESDAKGFLKNKGELFFKKLK